MEPKTSVVTFTPNLIHRSPTSDREDPSRPRLRHLIHRLLPCWKEPRATPALLTSSHFNYYCYSWCIPTLPIIPTCPHSIISLSLSTDLSSPFLHHSTNERNSQRADLPINTGDTATANTYLRPPSQHRRNGSNEQQAPPKGAGQGIHLYHPIYPHHSLQN
jgi:hypothetical protein